MSLDPQRRGEIRGLIGNYDGIHYPPTKGLLSSWKTLFRRTVAYQQLVRFPPQGSSVDVCVQCSHWTHTIKLFLVGLPEGRRTKGLEYNGPRYRGEDLRDVPHTRVQKDFRQTGRKVYRGHREGLQIPNSLQRRYG